MENRGALPKDHELGEKKKEKEQSSFYRRGLCLLTCLLMGDPTAANFPITRGLAIQPYSLIQAEPNAFP